MSKLLKEKDSGTYYKEVRVEDDPKELRGLLNETRWEILKMVAERPRYPAEIAKELGMHEQKVYYHIRQMEDSGIIEVSETEERGGALAKYYRVKDHGFVLELPYGDRRLTDFTIKEESPALRAFLEPFVRDGKINSRIVVGSPDPHGPHQVRARDAHLASDVGLFMGQYGAFQGEHTTLDVDVKASEDFGGNMILLGGPLTNMVTAEFNSRFPVKFNVENFPFREIVSEQTGKEYTDDSVGFISRIPNPENPENSVLVLAGVRFRGTRAAVKAFTDRHRAVFDSYDGEEKWGAVVRGKDMDGDGKIDQLEILEP